MIFREMGLPESWKSVCRAIVQGDPVLLSLFQESGEPTFENPSLRNMACVFEGNKNPEYTRGRHNKT